VLLSYLMFASTSVQIDNTVATSLFLCVVTFSVNIGTMRVEGYRHLLLVIAVPSCLILHNIYDD
jgi:hypothetical protein